MLLYREFELRLYGQKNVFQERDQVSSSPLQYIIFIVAYYFHDVSIALEKRHILRGYCATTCWHGGGSLFSDRAPSSSTPESNFLKRLSRCVVQIFRVLLCHKNSHRLRRVVQKTVTELFLIFILSVILVAPAELLEAWRFRVSSVYLYQFKFRLM